MKSRNVAPSTLSHGRCEEMADRMFKECSRLGVQMELVTKEWTTREIHFEEADVGAGKAAGWSGAWFGHPDDDARLAADR